MMRPSGAALLIAEAGEGEERSESDTQRVRLACSRRTVGGTHTVRPSGAALLIAEAGEGRVRSERRTQRVRLTRSRRAVGGTHMVRPSGGYGAALP